MTKFLVFFFPILFFGQNVTFQMAEIDKELNLKEKGKFDEKSVSAFDLGNEYLVFMQSGNLSLYNNSNGKRRNKIKVLSDFEVKIASGNNIVRLSKENISCIKIDNKEKKIGFTLRYGLYKSVYINDPKKINALWNAAANEITHFSYSRLNDRYFLFYKFYPDSISMDGRFSVFNKVNINAGSFYYKENINNEMYKIQTVSFNRNETVFGGLRVDSCLWLWDTAKTNVVNVIRIEGKKIKSFSFIGNDTIVFLYDNVFSIRTIKNYTINQARLLFNLCTQSELHGFIYNQARDFFVTYTNRKVILFRIKGDKFEIKSEMLFKGKLMDLKISEDGNNLVVLSETEW